MAQSKKPGYGLVRAKNPATGAELSTTEAYAARHNLTIIDKPAADAFGRVRGAVPGTGAAARPVSTSMTRDDLEAAAAGAGVSAEVIEAAKNKGELVEAIKSTTGDGTAGATPTEPNPEA